MMQVTPRKSLSKITPQHLWLSVSVTTLFKGRTMFVVDVEEVGTTTSEVAVEVEAEGVVGVIERIEESLLLGTMKGVRSRRESLSVIVAQVEERKCPVVVVELLELVMCTRKPGKARKTPSLFLKRAVLS